MMGSMGGIAAETKVEAGCSRSLHSVLTYKNITVDQGKKLDYLSTGIL